MSAGNEPNGPLLSQHAALVLLIAVLVGTGAGILTYLAGNPPADAVLAGGAAFGATAAFANWAID